MSPSADLLKPNTIHFNEQEQFRLGYKELLFLAFTLGIGFCGFKVCVDKIYSVNDPQQIQNITVHQSGSSSKTTSSAKMYYLASH